MIWNSWFNEGKSFGCLLLLKIFGSECISWTFGRPQHNEDNADVLDVFWTKLRAFFGSEEVFAVKFAHAMDFCGSRGHKTNALATLAVCCGTQCFITDSWFRWFFPAASIPNDLAMPGSSFEQKSLP